MYRTHYTAKSIWTPDNHSYMCLLNITFHRISTAALLLHYLLEQRTLSHVCPSSLPVQVYNLGTGTGYSVLQMVKAMEKASGRKVSI